MADLARVAGLVLAAGSSRRLGRPKQLVVLDGRPLLQHAIDAASAAGLGEIVVVLGHAAGDVAAAVGLPSHGRIVLNPDHATGQASSLRAGLRDLGTGIDRVVVMLGDQPRVDPDVVAAVAAAPGPIARASYRGEPCHPVAFDRALWPALMAVDGDRGARDVIGAHAASVHAVAVDAPAPADVDTDADLAALGGSG